MKNHRIILADWIGHIGYLISAGTTIWLLAAAFCEGRLQCLFPAVLTAAAACGLLVLADWADAQKARMRERTACRKYHCGRKAA